MSGYHMAVVAGVVFFTVRALLALIPALTVGFPIKKWSAAAALAAAAFYLLLSGAEVATQRSFFMTAVVLIAVMVDRRAVTFRTLAVAAMIVLAIGSPFLRAQTLTFSDATYGFGAGIFFVGYFLFEVPSNLLLERIGVRKTMLRIMFTWGIVACAMAFVQTPLQFYIARFLLGVLEAGFFPGIILYLTYWYPSARRGAIIAMFMTATAIASVIAGPLSGATMKYFNDIEGWHGWQWLFISQGVPASILGLAAYFYLQDKPEDAKWLSTEEKTALRFQLDHDHKDVESAHHAGFFQMLKDPKVYGLAFTYFLLLGATYTMVFWIPSLIKSWGVADLLQ